MNFKIDKFGNYLMLGQVVMINVLKTNKSDVTDDL